MITKKRWNALCGRLEALARGLTLTTVWGKIRLYRIEKARVKSSCMRDRSAARGKLKKDMACVYIATSSVENCGPPSSKITPKLVKSKIKTSSAAARMEGRNRAIVTRQKTRPGFAPRLRAACSRRESRCVMALPTILITMVVL